MAKICAPGPRGIRCRDWPDDRDAPRGWRKMTDAQCANLSRNSSLLSRVPHRSRISMAAIRAAEEEIDTGVDLFDPLDLVPIPENINEGLTSPKNSTMLQILGMPRDHVDAKCRMPTNHPLIDLIVTKDVGPFRVTGIAPAVRSLKKIFGKIKKDLPEVYAELGTAGMTCVRYIKNSNKLSNHSWGCAIDLKLGKVLDGIQYPGAGDDGVTLAGLVAISPYFHKEGWYWGVGFSSFEDGMHFEVADETLREWQQDGTLGEEIENRTVSAPALSIGDRGADVKELQSLLLELGYDILVDGQFGPITHSIVIDFQARSGLVPDGIAGPATMAALRKQQ